ncbi:ketopantoate reductase family protein [Colwellia sp. MB3u-70]|uniref:ketopantoate reductase family protein n=1 Tax=unclassified Colwellia TaxID=196834 RepID=UPI0015F3EC2A|nr:MULTISPECIES: ketopantoate reductase family protein [unclassified Colwellia]MBA6291945.1 ketopantoate reductase family protein [Colwellia sp. MB3u-8]MBA6308589.1 ketopantoate reductase family protein [Colwellia sp. MB3u-70]
MNIVVIGQGAIGLLWYHHLTKVQENSVSLSCSASASSVPKHYHFTDLKNHSEQGVLTLANNTTFANADLILLCVKSYQVKTAIAALNNKISTQAIIVFCHNGMGAYHDLAKFQQPCLALLTTHGCKITRPFHAQHTGLGHHDLGLIAGDIRPSIRDELIATLAQALPTLTFTENIKDKQWLKLAINCVINPITAIENINNGQLLDDKFKSLITKLIHEIIAVAAYENINFDFNELQASILQVARNTAKNCSSMRSDILQQRKTEIDYINGYIVNVARKAGLGTPQNEKIIQQVRALEV